jgi:hypothetical protein
MQNRREQIGTVKDVERCLVEILGTVPGVEAILYRRAGREHHVWTVIRRDSERLRHRIYRLQGEIMDRFRRHLFDFSVPARESGLLTTWAPTGMRRLPSFRDGARSVPPRGRRASKRRARGPRLP